MEDISEILQVYASSKFTPESIRSIFQNSDTYNFINDAGEIGSFGFSHYLFQQGVLATLLPVKIESLHRMFVDMYEKRYNRMVSNKHDDDNAQNGRNKSAVLQSIMHHLLLLNDEKPRKWKFLNLAFEDCAVIHRVIEGIYYFQLIQELERQKNSSEITGLLDSMSHFNKGRRLYLLAQLYYDTG